jgi:hypothetical protein
MAIDDETIDDIEQAVAEDIESGIQSTTADGTTVVASDPIRRLDALERLERRNAANTNFFGMRPRLLIPPGGGGSNAR